MIVSIEVDDEKIRNDASHFDGMEKPFVLVPTYGAESIDWKRIDMASSYRSPNSHLGAPTGFDGDGNRVDTYTNHISLRSLNTSPELLSEHGVAVGLETNTGTLWGQSPGKNHPVNDES